MATKLSKGMSRRDNGKSVLGCIVLKFSFASIKNTPKSGLSGCFDLDHAQHNIHSADAAHNEPPALRVARQHATPSNAKTVSP
ncbi:MAG: hypothetical protein KIH69_013955 [Anaerolineae bacterium]|nr:hypothetical protein [Anaerolineae bacterium]